jgi:hypothetical protein
VLGRRPEYSSADRVEVFLEDGPDTLMIVIEGLVLLVRGRRSVAVQRCNGV